MTPRVATSGPSLSWTVPSARRADSKSRLVFECRGETPAPLRMSADATGCRDFVNVGGGASDGDGDGAGVLPVRNIPARAGGQRCGVVGVSLANSRPYGALSGPPEIPHVLQMKQTSKLAQKNKKKTTTTKQKLWTKSKGGHFAGEKRREGRGEGGGGGYLFPIMRRMRCYVSVARRPADVRRCRFIASVAFPVVADDNDDDIPPRTAEPAARLVVDDRGRLPAASFGSDGAPFRDALGSPDDRFLQKT